MNWSLKPKEKESKKTNVTKDTKKVVPNDFKKMMGLSFIHEETKMRA